VLVAELPDRVNGGILLQIAAENLGGAAEAAGFKNLGQASFQKLS
jgi:hypothetical protein